MVLVFKQNLNGSFVTVVEAACMNDDGSNDASEAAPDNLSRSLLLSMVVIDGLIY
jgi:hypothetical protein